MNNLRILLSEVMMKLRWPVWLNRNILGFSLASTMGDANHEIVPLVLPLLISQLVGKQTAPEIVAFISGISTMVASISGLYAGKISDQLSNRKPLIVVGYFLTGSLVGLLAFANHWIVVLLLMVGAWIGRGMVSAPRNAIIADSTSQEYYGRAFGFRQALDTIGSVIGPLIVYVLAGWQVQSFFLVALVPGLLAFLLVYLFVEDVPRDIKKPDYPFTILFIFRNSLPKAFYSLLGVFLLFGLGSFNKTLVILRMQEVLSPQSTPVKLLSLITLLYVFRNIIQTFSSYAVGALSDKIGRIIPLALFGFGFFGIMALLLTFKTASLPLAILIFFLSGFSAGACMTLQKSLAADLLPEEIRGTGYGILKTVDSLGNLVSSIAIGIIWSQIGPEPAFIIAALISFVSVIVLLRLKI